MPAEPFLAPRHPASSWMAKLDRAKTHLDELQRLVSDYQARAHELVEEESGDPRTVTLRLRLHEPIPLVFSLIIGDIVDNLRSSLDNLAYELARRHAGGDLPPDLERMPAFPIYSSIKDYNSFFKTKRKVFWVFERAGRSRARL